MSQVEVVLDASSKRKITVTNERVTLRVFSSDPSELVDKLIRVAENAAIELRPVALTQRADVRLFDDGTVLLCFYESSGKLRHASRTLRFT